MYLLKYTLHVEIRCDARTYLCDLISVGNGITDSIMTHFLWKQDTNDF